MAKLNRAFDPQAHSTEQRERTEYQDLPNGDYELEVIEADVNPTAKGNGEYIKAKYSVLRPEKFKGQWIWDIINIDNPSAEAQRIGEERLAALCRAMGHDETVGDTDELLLRRFTARVEMGKPSKNNNPKTGQPYPAKPEVRKFYFPDEGDVPEPSVEESKAPANDNQPATAPAASTAAPAAAPKRSWQRR